MFYCTLAALPAGGLVFHWLLADRQPSWHTVALCCLAMGLIITAATYFVDVVKPDRAAADAEARRKERFFRGKE